MKLDIYHKQAIKKIFFSFMIIIVYLVGSNLTLPGVNMQDLLEYNTLSGGVFAFEATGLSLSKISFFSIGLGPWMSALILWRIFSAVKIFNIKSLTDKQSYRMKYLLTITLGIVQSIGILSMVSFLKIKENVSIWMLVIFLVTGLVILMWMGSMNSRYGFGGFILIILVNMMRSFINTIAQISFPIPGTFMDNTLFFILLIVGLWILFTVFRFMNGQVRIPLMQIMLDHKNYNTYLPIPTNPAGGLPYMYASSFVLLPRYIFMLSEKLFDKQGFSEQLQTNRPLGAFFLIIIVLIFTYIFSYINLDYKEISDNLKKSGNYIENVYSGRNTEQFLFQHITKMATISAVINCSILSSPVFLSVFWKISSESPILNLIPNCFLILFLGQEVCRNIYLTYNRNNYSEFLIVK